MVSPQTWAPLPTSCLRMLTMSCHSSGLVTMSGPSHSRYCAKLQTTLKFQFIGTCHKKLFYADRKQHAHCCTNSQWNI